MEEAIARFGEGGQDEAVGAVGTAEADTTSEVFLSGLFEGLSTGKGARNVDGVRGGVREEITGGSGRNVRRRRRDDSPLW